MESPTPRSAADQPPGPDAGTRRATAAPRVACCAALRNDPSVSGPTVSAGMVAFVERAAPAFSCPEAPDVAAPAPAAAEPTAAATTPPPPRAMNWRRDQRHPDPPPPGSPARQCNPARPPPANSLGTGAQRTGLCHLRTRYAGALEGHTNAFSVCGWKIGR